ncbi:MAG: acyl-ACP--UDP-N-acetylglucosamine O-acyltransferase [Nitrospirota bacterium]|nr:acyl-ACP--UDP-N-acetylglucosamine O-acyltransferase [Nitrospirota bacterium]
MTETAIHPTALVDPKAELGSGVSVGPFTVIGPQVRVGDGCEIGSHVVLSGNTTIGPGNRIFPHNAIGGIPQDLKYAGEDTRLEIGERNTFREFMTVNLGTEGGGGVTRIGNGNLFMAYVHVAHDCIIGDRTILANAVTLAGHVEVEDGAVVGGLSAVHQFTRIGSLAMIGGCSAVDQDVAPFCMAIGNRISLRGLNLVGLKRLGLSRDDIRILKDAYGELFTTDRPLKESVQVIQNKWPKDIRVARLAAFVEASERGVCR